MLEIERAESLFDEIIIERLVAPGRCVRLKQ
jgi:hypothetical protein